MHDAEKVAAIIEVVEDIVGHDDEEVVTYLMAALVHRLGTAEVTAWAKRHLVQQAMEEKNGQPSH